jgi:O-acetylhomoserine/O-acetylserine sulfhydrylase-like pyridoxal-dependent enzyme
VFKNADEGAALFKGEEEGYVYTRIGNPTVKVLEAKMNALEGAQWKLDNPEGRVSSIAFSSGMAAISAAMMACAQAGETLLVSKVNTTGQIVLAATILANLGFGLGAGKLVGFLIIFVAVFTILSAMAYLTDWFNHMVRYE